MTSQIDIQFFGAIVLCLFAAFFAALGDNLVRLSYTKEATKVSEGDAPTPTCCRPLWLFGMFSLAGLNTLFTLWSYALADAVTILLLFL